MSGKTFMQISANDLVNTCVKCGKSWQDKEQREIETMLFEAATADFAGNHKRGSQLSDQARERFLRIKHPERCPHCNSSEWLK